jgi:hypothetical protein
MSAHDELASAPGSVAPGLVPREMPERGWGAYADVPPLRMARWRWSGDPALFDSLDANGDAFVDEHELGRGLGRGAEILRGRVMGPLDASSWGGSPAVFRLVDADRDGWVTQGELARALGTHALRLVRGEPAHGPALPRGATVSWRGHAHWVTFPDREAKAAYMQAAAEDDQWDPAVVAWARQFTSLPLAERARAILRFVQRCIRYERDPATHDAEGVRHGIELLDGSAVGFNRAYGDCDLKARMLVALCLASGCQARIDPVFTGENGFPHVRAVVWVDGRGWQVADPTIVNSEIGWLPPKPLTKFPPGDPEA